MFDNKVDAVKTQGELTLSHHTFQEMHSSKHDINQSEKALIYTIILIAIYLGLERVYYFYYKYVTESHIDSQNNMLPNYYTSLKFGDCREFLEDEANFRNLGFKCLDDQAVRKIEEVKENREGGSSENNSLFDGIKEFDDENVNASLVPSKKNDI